MNIYVLRECGSIIYYKNGKKANIAKAKYYLAGNPTRELQWIMAEIEYFRDKIWRFIEKQLFSKQHFWYNFIFGKNKTTKINGKIRRKLRKTYEKAIKFSYHRYWAIFPIIMKKEILKNMKLKECSKELACKKRKKGGKAYIFDEKYVGKLKGGSVTYYWSPITKMPILIKENYNKLLVVAPREK